MYRRLRFCWAAGTTAVGLSVRRGWSSRYSQRIQRAQCPYVDDTHHPNATQSAVQAGWGPDLMSTLRLWITLGMAAGGCGSVERPALGGAGPAAGAGLDAPGSTARSAAQDSELTLANPLRAFLPDSTCWSVCRETHQHLTSQALGTHTHTHTHTGAHAHTHTGTRTHTQAHPHTHRHTHIYHDR